jgi:hypothetical protein
MYHHSFHFSSFCASVIFDLIYVRVRWFLANFIRGRGRHINVVGVGAAHDGHGVGLRLFAFGV